MTLGKLESAVSHLFFWGAFLLLGLAVLERAANEFGYTIVRAVKAATMLEGAVVLLVFVIAAQLRAIREAFKRQG
jgi:hypothetical protein